MSTSVTACTESSPFTPVHSPLRIHSYPFTRDLPYLNPSTSNSFHLLFFSGVIFEYDQSSESHQAIVLLLQDQLSDPQLIHRMESISHFTPQPDTGDPPLSANPFQIPETLSAPITSSEMLSPQVNEGLFDIHDFNPDVHKFDPFQYMDYGSPSPEPQDTAPSQEDQTDAPTNTDLDDVVTAKPTRSEVPHREGLAEDSWLNSQLSDLTDWNRETVRQDILETERAAAHTSNSLDDPEESIPSRDEQAAVEDCRKMSALSKDELVAASGSFFGQNLPEERPFDPEEEIEDIEYISYNYDEPIEWSAEPVKHSAPGPEYPTCSSTDTGPIDDSTIKPNVHVVVGQSGPENGINATDIADPRGQSSEGVPSGAEQVAANDQPIVDESITSSYFRDFYDPENPLVLTPSMTRAQEMEIGQAAMRIGLEKPSMNLPDDLEWVPRIQFVSAPKVRQGPGDAEQTRDLGDQLTSSRKRKFSEVDEETGLRSEKSHLGTPQTSGSQSSGGGPSARQRYSGRNKPMEKSPNAFVTQSATGCGPASATSHLAEDRQRAVPLTVSSERMDTIGAQPEMLQGVFAGPHYQPHGYPADTQRLETVKTPNVAQSYEHESDYVQFARANAELGEFVDAISLRGNEVGPRNQFGYGYQAPSIASNRFEVNPSNRSCVEPPQGSMITPSPSIPSDTTCTSKKRKADDSDDFKPAKKVKANILSADKRKTYFPNHPLATEPLPDGISDVDIIRQYPNHLYGALIMRLYYAGFTQKKMCEMILGEPQTSEAREEHRRIINVLLKRIEAEMFANDIDPKEAMAGSRDKTEEARANRKIADARRKANGTNVANRRRAKSQAVSNQPDVAPQAVSNQPVVAPQTAGQAMLAPTFDASTIDPRLSMSEPTGRHYQPQDPSLSTGLTESAHPEAFSRIHGVASSEHRVDEGSIGVIDMNNNAPSSTDFEYLAPATYESTFGNSQTSVRAEIMTAYDQYHPEDSSSEAPEQPEIMGSTYHSPYSQVQQNSPSEDRTLMYSQNHNREMS
ncbi:MAG: hypothetical protein M1835_006008, partial [Candelina submexicana]